MMHVTALPVDREAHSFSRCDETGPGALLGHMKHIDETRSSVGIRGAADRVRDTRGASETGAVDARAGCTASWGAANCIGPDGRRCKGGTRRRWRCRSAPEQLAPESGMRKATLASTPGICNEPWSRATGSKMDQFQNSATGLRRARVSPDLRSNTGGRLLRDQGPSPGFRAPPPCSGPSRRGSACGSGSPTAD